MMKKLISVTNDEKTSLVKLTERRNSLIELREILEDEEIIDQQQSDFEKNQKNINIWWNNVLNEYNLENIEQTCYFLDFNDGFIYSN